ncbi:MAG: TAT-dependent nitrous-oxide reductase [Zoogloea sp.]|uniref:TAT-dependent nitrous-oxide reductase n=1 Tax=Zoogloea sp. TaxID=49181 RepID=UPI00262A0997|nr:TAT-dependent nitrous-oxide reductase [Zoogloea sp.]MDD3326703.1 TAT-dependent nitrous-oxide reductase [Zoogloea sp.]
MSNEDIKHDDQNLVPGRRKFLNTAALAGLAGAGLSVGLSSCKQEAAQPAAAPAGAPAAAHGAAGDLNLHPAPGQLDTYYGVWSGGHSGEVRVLGLPSGREIKRVPTFNIDCMSGWGITNESKAIIGTKADGSLKYKTGDTHHIHGSYVDGTYDGKYYWVNDKIHGRIARIRGDVFECDKITEIPNIQGFHGIFPDKRDPVDQAINHTTRVFCGNEFHIPHPNDGRDADDPTKYKTLFTCVDAETMEVRWQCRVDGNMDLVATSYNGRLAAANQYNVEGGAKYEDMMSAEKDACVFFDVGRIEKAIKDGKFTTIGDSKVPVVDGTKEANKDPKTALTCYVPVPKNPHGVNASPDGKYFICSGKLSPTATVIDLAKVEEFLDGKLDDLNKSIVAEVEIGLGPLHTTYDGRGNAFTTLFLDSQIVKWNIDAAIKFHAGDKNVKYVVDRIDVHYQPGHISADMGETKEAGGQFLAVGCKFSKDRFLPVGPLHPENEQLIDIRGEKMKMLADHPVYPEPHDFIIVKREKVKTKQVFNVDDFPNAVKDAKDSGVFREGNKVTVKLVSQAPAYSLRDFKLKKGDEVTIILTNLDKVEDLTHGFAIPKYDINFIVNPQETKSVTFKADKPGVYWCYCTHFCHALHLEMRTRMIVEK